ncbi:MAG: hypothetical protein HOO95_08855 [Gallionella sp.]|nr:hypothetical protein [Gallionella sp.]
MKNITLTVALLALSACSTATFTAQPYQPSIEATSALQNLGLSGIEIESVTSSVDIDNSCPSSARAISLPNKSGFEDYIKDALISEFTIADIYDKKSPKVKLKIDITELEYFLSHSSLMSVWDIEFIIDSSNGTSLKVHEHFLFDAGAYNLWNCRKIADAYMPAVKAVITKLAKSPSLRTLLTPQASDLERISP